MREYLQFLQQYHPIALRVWFFGLGACVGSFLNVCILRLPLGRSIVTPRSQCVCGKMIPWYDNIPIFSWFILRGRARCCGAKFSIRYALIEALTACVFLMLWMTLRPGPAIAGMAFFALLLLGAMIDLDHMILPDISTLGGLCAGLVFSLVWPQIHGLPGGDWNWVGARQSLGLALAGGVIGAGIIYWIGELGRFFLKKEAMGYGDMLLMGCVGAFCGWQGTLAAIFGGAVLALLGIILMSLLGHLWSAKANNTEELLPDEPSPAPLGKRQFKFDYLLVIAAAIGGFAWLWHERGILMVWPGIVFLGLIFILAVLQRGRLAVNEGGLLLGVLAGVVVACVLPQMHGLAPSGLWLIDAMRGAVLSGIDAIAGAGLALWLFEFANLLRFYLMPPPASPNSGEEDAGQIWGDGYLLLFGVMGAFCGWKAVVIALAFFAALGAVKAVWILIGARSAAGKNHAPAVEKSAASAENITPPASDATNALTWTLGKEIPFGPWLALGGFIYYAWPWLHAGWNNYFVTLHALIFQTPAIN